MRGQRQRDALSAKSCIAHVRGDKDLAQGSVDRQVAGNEPAADRAQEVGGVENGIAGVVGMDDPTVSVDQDHAGTQSIENIGKAYRFGLLAMDGLADQQGATDVGYQERHAPAHFVIDQAVRFMAYNAEKRTTYRRFLDHCACNVDPAMRPRPLLVKAAPAKLFVGHEVRGAYDLFDAEARRVRRRIEFRIALRIDLQAVRVGADITIQNLGLAQGMFREKPARMAPGKAGNFIEDIVSLRGVDYGVVDLTNQRRQLLAIVHGSWPRCNNLNEMAFSYRRTDITIQWHFEGGRCWPQHCMARNGHAPL